MRVIQEIARRRRLTGWETQAMEIMPRSEAERVVSGESAVVEKLVAEAALEAISAGFRSPEGDPIRWERMRSVQVIA